MLKERGSKDAESSNSSSLPLIISSSAQKVNGTRPWSTGQNRNSSGESCLLGNLDRKLYNQLWSLSETTLPKQNPSEHKVLTLTPSRQNLSAAPLCQCLFFNILLSSPKLCLISFSQQQEKWQAKTGLSGWRSRQDLLALMPSFEAQGHSSCYVS